MAIENVTHTGLDYDEYSMYHYYTCEENITAKVMFLHSLERLKSGILGSYLITMVVGLAGNFLVFYVIGKNSQIRNKSVANYYIWNLAFADLLFLLTMPVFCYATYCDDWPFGTLMCKVSKVFFETNRYASMFTLVALSVDRYLASFYNMGHLRTMKAGIIVCAAIWIMCALISIPYWIHTEVYNRQCRTNFSTDFLTFWKFVQLILALLIPFLVICISYILLAIRLHKILKRSIQKPSKKMIRTILVVIVIFVVCQVPWHAHELISWRIHVKYTGGSCTPTIPELKLSMYFNTVATILGFVSSCANPIIYGILNDNYRKQYRAVLCCCQGGGSEGNDSPSMSRRASAGLTQTRVRYSFKIAFHPPCLSQNGEEEPGAGCQHQRLSPVSQDCTLARPATTEHIQMVIDDDSEQEDNHVL